MLTNKNEVHESICRRINSGNAYYSAQKCYDPICFPNTEVHDIYKKIKYKITH
jgi:hypothetical protein